MQKKIAIFSGTRVGAYCIRPTNDHDNGRMNEKMGVLRFIFIRGMGNRVGIGPRFVRGMDFGVRIRFIRPLPWPFVETYAIRPYPDGRNSIHFFAHSASGVAVCGAYAIRPYTGDLKNGDFSIRSTTGVAVYGAYAVAPYTDRRKPGWFLVRISRGGGKGGGAWVVRKVG